MHLRQTAIAVTQLGVAAWGKAAIAAGALFAQGCVFWGNGAIAKAASGGLPVRAAQARMVSLPLDSE